MIDRLRIQPAPNLIVRKPGTKIPVTAGTWVNAADPYWRKLLEAGEILPMPETPPAVAKPKKTAVTDDHVQ